MAEVSENQKDFDALVKRVEELEAAQEAAEKAAEAKTSEQKEAPKVLTFEQGKSTYEVPVGLKLSMGGTKVTAKDIVSSDALQKKVLKAKIKSVKKV